MAASSRIIGLISAIAALLLAGPVVHLYHTHGEHSCCASRPIDAVSHACGHHHHHDHSSHGGESGSEQDNDPMDSHDCSICQALAIQALPAVFAGQELVSDLSGELTLPLPRIAPQAILLAYHGRGPPDA